MGNPWVKEQVGIVNQLLKDPDNVQLWEQLACITGTQRLDDNTTVQCCRFDPYRNAIELSRCDSCPLRVDRTDEMRGLGGPIAQYLCRRYRGQQTWNIESGEIVRRLLEFLAFIQVEPPTLKVKKSRAR